MTNNQKFNLFQKSLRKNKWAHQTPIPMETNWKAHFFFNNKLVRTVTFEMPIGTRQSDAGRKAADLYNVGNATGWHRQLLGFDTATGKLFKF